MKRAYEGLGELELRERSPNEVAVIQIHAEDDLHPITENRLHQFTLTPSKPLTEKQKGDYLDSVARHLRMAADA